MSHGRIKAVGMIHACTRRSVKLRLNTTTTADREERRSEPRLPLPLVRRRCGREPTNSTVTYLTGRTSVDAATVPSDNLHGEKALDAEATPGPTLLRQLGVVLEIYRNTARSIRPKVALAVKLSHFRWCNPGERDLWLTG